VASIIDLCRHLPQRTFAAGECILEEGKTAGVLYVLAAGVVEITKSEVQITTVSDPGAFFGEVSVLLGIPHMASVKAVTDATLYLAENPHRFLTSSPEIALSLAALLAKRLHFVTTYLVDFKRQFEGHEDHFGMVDEVLENLVHHQAAPSTPGSDRHPDKQVD
jgi:CRP/FNR family cyclic AMP-dependent transcriptional regulator